MNLVYILPSGLCLVASENFAAFGSAGRSSARCMPGCGGKRTERGYTNSTSERKRPPGICRQPITIRTTEKSASSVELIIHVYLALTLHLWADCVFRPLMFLLT
uniref:Uncharacterized protein n=1 Tax=Arundo donax TaxID=35708 RepID=A0A0A9NYR1_ARUDO